MISQSVEVSHETAFNLLTEAMRYAKDKQWEVAVAVVNPHGTLMGFLRTNKALIPSSDIATDKAYTAATMRMASREWYDIVAAKPSMSLGMANRDRLMVWTGGLPIMHEGTCIGGIGVSGVRDFEDEECARAALTALGLA